MGQWIDDYELTEAQRATLAALDAEWKGIDADLANDPAPDDRDRMLGRLDAIEHEIVV